MKETQDLEFCINVREFKEEEQKIRKEILIVKKAKVIRSVSEVLLHDGEKRTKFTVLDSKKCHNMGWTWETGNCQR